MEEEFGRVVVVGEEGRGGKRGASGPGAEEGGRVGRGSRVEGAHAVGVDLGVQRPGGPAVGGLAVVVVGAAGGGWRRRHGGRAGWGWVFPPRSSLRVRGRAGLAGVDAKGEAVCVRAQGVCCACVVL